jgi:hypothetical protein
MATPHDRTQDPLHGITLESMLTELVDHFDWDTMGQRIQIRCFTSEPRPEVFTQDAMGSQEGRRDVLVYARQLSTGGAGLRHGMRLRG